MLPPDPAPSVEPARWAQDRYVWGDSWVTREVGTGFERYVRVFHPYDRDDDVKTWAEVAAAHGKVMHACASWDEITADGPWDPDADPDTNRNGGVYVVGNLVRPVLDVVCAVLRRHTDTPGNCFFGVWDGFGWERVPKPSAVSVAFRVTADDAPSGPVRSKSARRLDPRAPQFSVPIRDFRLYQGQLEQATQIGGGDYFDDEGFFLAQSPTLMWPADHAWYLSTEIDAEHTIIGGTAALADDLVAAAGVEALVVDPDAPLVTDVNQ